MCVSSFRAYSCIERISFGGLAKILSFLLKFLPTLPYKIAKCPKLFPEICFKNLDKHTPIFHYSRQRSLSKFHLYYNPFYISSIWYVSAKFHNGSARGVPPLSLPPPPSEMSVLCYLLRSHSLYLIYPYILPTDRLLIFSIRLRPTYRGAIMKQHNPCEHVPKALFGMNNY